MAFHSGGVGERKGEDTEHIQYSPRIIEYSGPEEQVVIRASSASMPRFAKYWGKVMLPAAFGQSFFLSTQLQSQTLSPCLTLFLNSTLHCKPITAMASPSLVMIFVQHHNH